MIPRILAPLSTTFVALRFRLVDAQGMDAKDVELYMGMQGHAAFVKDDGSVFAHVHPSGSVPAAAMGLAMPDNPHAMHMQPHSGLPARVAFPYGLPKPGDYRIFVQMKRGGEIMTGIFNAMAGNHSELTAGELLGITRPRAGGVG